MPTHARASRLRALTVAVTAAAGVAACTAPLTVEPAPYAGDPRCARIMLGIPEEVGGLALRATSSQATAAYGETNEIVVRCGVEPPGPSEDRCVAVDVGATAQDWLISEEAEVWRAVSFGRTPAVEVIIPRARADRAVGELLGAFNSSVAQADTNGLACR